jgi:acetyl-CoA carboxylase biotin carboxyl carrier protein
MDLKEIQNLIKFVANSGVAEVKLEMDDVKITIKTTVEGNNTEATYIQQIPAAVAPVAIPQQVAPVIATPVAETKTEEKSNLITIKSPIIGTFYRKPSPDKPTFTEVGATVSKGDVLCVIEAMKLFNEIESEVSGKIVKILVDDMSPVEFDQPLFLVDPS